VSVKPVHSLVHQFSRQALLSAHLTSFPGSCRAAVREQHRAPTRIHNILEGTSGTEC